MKEAFSLRTVRKKDCYALQAGGYRADFLLYSIHPFACQRRCFLPNLAGFSSDAGSGRPSKLSLSK